MRVLHGLIEQYFFEYGKGIVDFTDYVISRSINVIDRMLENKRDVSFYIACHINSNLSDDFNEFNNALSWLAYVILRRSSFYRSRRDKKILYKCYAECLKDFRTEAIQMVTKYKHVLGKEIITRLKRKRKACKPKKNKYIPSLIHCYLSQYQTVEKIKEMLLDDIETFNNIFAPMDVMEIADDCVRKEFIGVCLWLKKKIFTYADKRELVEYELLCDRCLEDLKSSINWAMAVIYGRDTKYYVKWNTTNILSKKRK